MQEPKSISDLIQSQADAPATESVDGQSVSERPLADLIAADQHISGGKALKSRRLGMVMRRIRHGDALGNSRGD